MNLIFFDWYLLRRVSFILLPKFAVFVYPAVAIGFTSYFENDLTLPVEFFVAASIVSFNLLLFLLKLGNFFMLISMFLSF